MPFDPPAPSEDPVILRARLDAAQREMGKLRSEIGSLLGTVDAAIRVMDMCRDRLRHTVLVAMDHGAPPEQLPAVPSDQLVEHFRRRRSAF